MKPKIQTLAIFLAVLSFVSAARATTLARLNLDQLTAAADAVARVRCTASDSVWDGGSIWTITQFDILETMKGTLAAHIAVRLPGGNVGGIRSVVEGAPQFKAGDQAVVFLERTPTGAFSIAGWVEGTFRIMHDLHGDEIVTQDSSAFSIFDPTTRAFHTEGIQRLPFEQFRARLATSMARAKDQSR